MYDQFKAAITAEEWKNVPSHNGISKTFQQMRSHVGQVLDGARLGVFVFGGAGLGKNHIVVDELKKRGFATIQPVTPRSVTDFLAEFHNATHDKDRGRPRKQVLPLVLDEARLIFESQANLNVLKLALDSGKDASRYHSGYVWFEQVSNGINEETGEEKFKKVRRQGTSLAAPIIAMTNKNLHEFEPRMQDHAEALLSRVPPIMVPNDPLEIWEYVVHIALTTDVITRHRGATLPLPKRAQIVDWFTENLHNLANVSVRTLEKIRDDVAMSSADLLSVNLDLHLKPKAKRSQRPGPNRQDWAALRKALG